MTTWNEKVGMRKPRDPLPTWVDEIFGFKLDPWQIRYMKRPRDRFTINASPSRGLMQIIDPTWEPK